MTVSIRLSDGGLGVFLVARDVLDGADLVSELDGFLLDHAEELSGVRFWYSDYTGATKIEIATEMLQRIAATCEVLARGVPDLVVVKVADKDFAFGLARMFEALADQTGWSFRVCRSQEEALSWLRESLGTEVTLGAAPV